MEPWLGGNTDAAALAACKLPSPAAMCQLSVERCDATSREKALEESRCAVAAAVATRVRCNAVCRCWHGDVRSSRTHGRSDIAEPCDVGGAEVESGSACDAYGACCGCGM